MKCSTKYNIRDKQQKFTLFAFLALAFFLSNLSQLHAGFGDDKKSNDEKSVDQKSDAEMEDKGTEEKEREEKKAASTSSSSHHPLEDSMQEDSKLGDNSNHLTLSRDRSLPTTPIVTPPTLPGTPIDPTGSTNSTPTAHRPGRSYAGFFSTSPIQSIGGTRAPTTSPASQNRALPAFQSSASTAFNPTSAPASPHDQTTQRSSARNGNHSGSRVPPLYIRNSTVPTLILPSFSQTHDNEDATLTALNATVAQPHAASSAAMAESFDAYTARSIIQQNPQQQIQPDQYTVITRDDLSEDELKELEERDVECGICLVVKIAEAFRNNANQQFARVNCGGGSGSTGNSKPSSSRASSTDEENTATSPSSRASSTDEKNEEASTSSRATPRPYTAGKGHIFCINCMKEEYQYRTVCAVCRQSIDPIPDTKRPDSN